MNKKNKTFNAAILTKLNKPLKIIKVSIPGELRKGQILVQLISSSICGAQVNEIQGVKGPDKYLPHMMGHEGYGKVIDTGPKVKKIKKNDNVILHWRKGSGIEADGAIYYSDKIGKINSGKVTTFSEMSVVSENRVTKIKITNQLKKIVPCFGCSLSTAYGLVFNETKMKQNDSVLILGAGGLGLSIAAMARSKGIKNIFFLDKSLNKFKLRFINDLNLKRKNILTSKHLINKNNNYKFDHVVDTTGNTKLISIGFDLLNKNSNLILVGQPRVGGLLEIKNPLKIFEGIKIYASDGGLVDPSIELKKISQHVMKNFKYFRNFMSHTVALKNINLGLKLLKSGKTLRVGIKF